MLRLATYFRSSAAYRVRIALHLKGLKWIDVPVNLRLAEHQDAGHIAINSQGLVPSLEISGQWLGQSLAIIEYLEETYSGPTILPTTAIARAQVRGLAQQLAIDIHPLNNLRVLKYLENNLGVDAAAKSDWYQHWIKLGFSAFEDALKRLGSTGRYCFGDQPSLADICLIPQVYNARRFNTDLSEYPLIELIDQHCNTLKAFQAAAPEQQADAV